MEDEAEIQVEDLIQEEDMVVTISHHGYIKRTPLSVYRAQRRGGKGNRGMEARNDDFIAQLIVESTHSFVFFFSNRGKVYVKKVFEVPQAARSGKGRAVVNFIGLDEGERIAAIGTGELLQSNFFVVETDQPNRPVMPGRLSAQSEQLVLPGLQVVPKHTYRWSMYFFWSAGCLAIRLERLRGVILVCCILLGTILLWANSLNIVR